MGRLPTWHIYQSICGLLPIYSAMATNLPSLRLAATIGYRVIAQGCYGPMSDGHDD